MYKTVSMKGYSSRLTALFQDFKNLKRNLLIEEICQEVLTLHLLTITLRRNLTPPGLFFAYVKAKNTPACIQRGM